MSDGGSWNDQTGGEQPDAPDGGAWGAPPPPPPPPAPPAPGYAAPGYPPPAQPAPGYTPGYPPPPAPQTNGMAVASMVLGILWLYWIGSILALIFGYVGKKQIDESQGRQGGRGMAVAGIVLGWIGVGVLLLVIVFGLIAGVTTGVF